MSGAPKKLLSLRSRPIDMDAAVGTYQPGKRRQRAASALTERPVIDLGKAKEKGINPVVLLGKPVVNAHNLNQTENQNAISSDSILRNIQKSLTEIAATNKSLVTEITQTKNLSIAKEEALRALQKSYDDLLQKSLAQEAEIKTLLKRIEQNKQQEFTDNLVLFDAVENEKQAGPASDDRMCDFCKNLFKST